MFSFLSNRNWLARGKYQLVHFKWIKINIQYNTYNSSLLNKEIILTTIPVTSSFLWRGLVINFICFDQSSLHSMYFFWLPFSSGFFQVGIYTLNYYLYCLIITIYYYIERDNPLLLNHIYLPILWKRFLGVLPKVLHYC